MNATVAHQLGSGSGNANDLRTLAITMAPIVEGVSNRLAREKRKQKHKPKGVRGKIAATVAPQPGSGSCNVTDFPAFTILMSHVGEGGVYLQQQRNVKYKKRRERNLKKKKKKRFTFCKKKEKRKKTNKPIGDRMDLVRIQALGLRAEARSPGLRSGARGLGFQCQRFKFWGPRPNVEDDIGPSSGPDASGLWAQGLGLRA